MNPFRRLSITAKLTLLFFLFAALILLGVGVFAYLSGHAAVEQAVISDLQSTANEKQAALDWWLNDRLRLLVTITGFPAYRAHVNLLINDNLDDTARKTLQAQTAQALAMFTGPNGDYAELLIVEARQGQVIVSTQADNVGKFKEDRPYFVEGKRGPFVQNIVYSLEDRAPVLIVSAPMKADDGRVIAVLAARLKLEEMNEIIVRRTGLRATDDAFLVNSSRLPVTQPRFLSDPAVLQRGIQTEPVDRCLAGNSGSVAAGDYRGVPVLAVYRWIPNRQLCLIVKIDQAEAFAPSDAFGRTLVGMALVALVLATLLGIGLARTITIPIRVLQDGVVRFGRGERAVRLAETRRDEIGILAREFNQMATALVEQETQLRDYASQLEQKVQARTRELRESEQRFRSLYENSSVGIYRTTPDGRILLANPALVQMLGYASFDELARRNLEQEGFDPAYARADFIRVIEREGEIRGLESAWIRKDGTAFFVRESARAIRDLLGKIMYYDGVVEDVTDRKRAEEKLRASEERFRTVADFTYDWEYWMDMAGNYVYVSPSCERVTGYRAEEFTSNPRLLEAVVHPDDQPLLMRHVREELDRNEMTSLDFRIIRRDGEMRWLSHNCRMVHGADGRWLGRRGSNRDITDRKRAEEELNRLNTELEQRVAARTAQLQAVNQELEAFAYSVSHDLRAPLRAIDGFSRMILEDYGGKFDAEGQRLFNVIRSNAQKMDQLITDLLTLSRITRGALITSRLDMTTLVQQVFAEITPPEERGKVVLSVASLPEVEGEPAQMRQVWSNLLANALKFTRPKAERRIEVGGYVEDNRNVYFVKDNGVGFNPRYAHKLFGIFQRLHKASEFEGTGVGLAIVQRIIHRHGGKVWAEGELNQGATFYFSLPILIIQK